MAVRRHRPTLDRNARVRSATLRAATLVTRTEHLDVDPTELDLVTFAGSDGLLWCHGGISLAGRGTAVRVPVDRVDDVLDTIEVESDDVDRPGTGAVAVG